MPLLAELLYEPLQVAIQSTPTDWKALHFSAWTTTIGAGVGALMGGLFSYWASVKAKLRINTVKNAELVYRLARRNKSELHVIDNKALMRKKTAGRIHNIRDMVEDYKDRVYEMCVLIEIRFPKEENLIEGIAEEVGVYFNERSVLSSMYHSGAKEILERGGINPSDRVFTKSNHVKGLKFALENRFGKIIERFKNIK